MPAYEFELRYRIPGCADPLDHADALFEAGCDDATLSSTGDRLILSFTREGTSFDAAVESARAAVEGAVPGAERIGDVQVPILVSDKDMEAARTISVNILVGWMLQAEDGTSVEHPPAVVDEARRRAESLVERPRGRNG